MKKILGSLFLAATVLVSVSSVASATPATCASQTVAAGLQCTLGGLTFDFSSVSFSPQSMNDALTLVAANTVVNGSDVVLGFQIGPGASGFPVDVTIAYTVTSDTANISGIDASYQGATGTIFENASVNGVVVSNISDGLNNNNVNVTGNPPTFGPYSSISISKDIDAIDFSEFTDSVQVSSVPEPMTLSMMGVGLLGLSLISRRRKKS
jgi:hypothetical protein